MPDGLSSCAEDGLPLSPAKPLASWYAQGVSDGLGDRLLMFDNSAAPSLELLRFRPDFAQAPGFETALREQVHRLGRFEHQAFARVRSVQRLEPDDDLALVSNFTPGKRLSEVLHRARGPALAAALIRQLAPALAILQQHGGGTSHGVLSADRIVVSPEGRLTIVEHVVGSAIDELNLAPERLASMGIAVPPAKNGAAPRLDAATDWYQLGLVAVSVLIGRPLTASELPQLEALLDRAAHSARSDGGSLPPLIRQWLDRALQISGGRIESGADARAALELLQADRSRHSLRGESVRATEPKPPAPAEPAPAPVAPSAPLADEPPRQHATTTWEGYRPPADPLAAFESEAAVATTPPLEASRGAVFHARPAAQPVLHTPRGVAQPRSPEAAPAAPPRLHDPRAAARTPVAEPHAAAAPRPRAAAPPGISTSVVVALALMAVVEAGVIAALARALWVAPPPAIVAATAAPGENTVAASSPADAPLRVTTAPDLRWVRVSSASAARPPEGPPSGAIRISSPIKLSVMEGARQLGSVPGADLKIPAGRHEIELVNLPLGYRLQQSLEIEAGEIVSIYIAPPQGWVTLYAVPAADVTIDGQAVGRTPLGPLPIALGEHDVTFRHPTGLKDQQRITIQSGETVRVIGNVHR